MATSTGMISPPVSVQASHFTADAPDLTFQSAHTGFIGVFTNYALQCGGFNYHTEVLDSVLFQLAWNEIAVGNFYFFFLDVTGEFDHLHAVKQGRGNRGK